MISPLSRMKQAVETGIRRMGPGSDARILEFAAFDKAVPSRRAPQEHRMADDRPEPSF
jgi:hypothetical protein